MGQFNLVSEYKPSGDQPKAIESLAEGVLRGDRFQTLLGVTGSGKTFTMANVIQTLQRPTLVIAHNKTLAGQLCSEFREFFPENAVEYFVSYYDYYQPEAYIPQTDTYIEKDSAINDEIDRLRHSATQSLLERRDVIIVASVSCIYGLGSPEEYQAATLHLRRDGTQDRDDALRKLVRMQFTRNDIALTRETFRVKGDTLEIHPADKDIIIRVEFFGDVIDRIRTLDPITGEILQERDRIIVFPASHFVTSKDRMTVAVSNIREEMEQQIKFFKDRNQLLEAQRIEQRTNYDLEMMQEVGYCSGIENYSRHLDGRRPGTAPNTLLDYFPGDFLMFIDESHQTIPQLNAMYSGDMARKKNLVEYGFRLPSARDNRPLRFAEFEGRLNQVIFTSATPGSYELEHSGQVVEQIIRPTGLIDPEVEIRPSKGQIEDLMHEIQDRAERGERTLVTTLTKKMAEDLSEYLADAGIKVHYLHSNIHTMERTEIIRDLRLGVHDVVVGINLLREGIDIPEVSLVAILDADKEGFLRSETSLIQTIGRAARNIQGKVIMYADDVTGSMKRAISETNRRRAIQAQYNKDHNITPKSISKAIRDVIESDESKAEKASKNYSLVDTLPPDQMGDMIKELEADMKRAAKNLDFETAALLRDEIARLRKLVPANVMRQKSPRRKQLREQMQKNKGSDATQQ